MVGGGGGWGAMIFIFSTGLEGHGRTGRTIITDIQSDLSLSPAQPGIPLLFLMFPVIGCLWRIRTMNDVKSPDHTRLHGT